MKKKQLQHIKECVERLKAENEQLKAENKNLNPSHEDVCRTDTLMLRREEGDIFISPRTNLKIEYKLSKYYLRGVIEWMEKGRYRR